MVWISPRVYKTNKAQIGPIPKKAD